MSERSPFVPKRIDQRDDDSDEEDDTQHSKKTKKQSPLETDLSVHRFSDILARMRAAGAYFYFEKQLERGSSSDINDRLQDFCTDHGLSKDTLERIKDLKRQLHSISKSVFEASALSSMDPDQSDPPSLIEETALRQILMYKKIFFFFFFFLYKLS